MMTTGNEKDHKHHRDDPQIVTLYNKHHFQ